MSMEETVERAREAFAGRTDDAFVCDLFDGPFKIDGRDMVIADLRALLAAYETMRGDVERAKARHSDEAEAHHKTRQRADRLQATLAKYGDHMIDCSAGMMEGGPCDCGFSDILRGMHGE